MAIQTKILDIINDPVSIGQATLGYKYDDVSGLITEIDIVNGTTMGAFASGTQVSIDAQGNVTFGKNYQTTVPAGQSQTITIPNGQANRLQLSVTPSGKLDGVQWEFRLV